MTVWERPEGARDVRPAPARHTLVNDESLRDGLQSPSVRDPAKPDKLALLHAMAEMGVDVASLGLPAAGPRAVEDATELAREIDRARLGILGTAAARTTEGDVNSIAEVSQRAGVALEVYAFIGSSPIRHYTEGWNDDFLLGKIRAAAGAARRAGLPFCLVTEDTTRAHPATLARLWDAAIEEGAARLCLCDTVGHADPFGVEALVTFVRSYLMSRGSSHVELDWHGHEDRGLGLANALAAARAGVERVHGTALGVGERVGNVAMEALIYNLGEMGYRPRVALEAVRRYTDVATRSLDWPISTFAPLVGERSRGLDEARASPCVLVAGGAAPAAADRTNGTTSPATLNPPAEEPEAWSIVRMRVNGDAVEHVTRPSRTLLEVLRYDLDLVGTRQGCDKGDCGACTVMIDGEAQLSCLTLAVHCDGRDVTTVESLRGPPELDPLLDAFDRLGAGQCGFCTPGMLMTASALLRKEVRPSRDTIRRAISGNLCRCTGYGPIVAAVELAAKIKAGEEPAGVDLPGALVPPPLPPLDKKRTEEKRG
jgi:2-isopropylmalate synthase